jgi:N-acetylglucosamine kinase-like BadF-type ATPase
MDRITSTVVQLVREQVPDAVVAITATGQTEASSQDVSSDALAAEIGRITRVPGVVAAAGTGGVFLDREVAGAGGVSAPVASRALSRGAARLGADVVAFPGYAVTLRRFC